MKFSCISRYVALLDCPISDKLNRPLLFTLFGNNSSNFQSFCGGLIALLSSRYAKVLRELLCFIM